MGQQISHMYVKRFAYLKKRKQCNICFAGFNPRHACFLKIA